MSVYDALAEAPYARGSWTAKIATNATGPDDQVMIIIPAFDPMLRLGPCRWQARDNVSLPQVGDTCLAVQDEKDDWWITSWWPDDPSFPPVELADGEIEGPKLNWHLGSTPPANPVDGMIWLNNVIGGQDWMFVYDSSDMTYPWRFIGGPPLSGSTSVDATLGATGWLAGTMITVPRSGVYCVSFVANCGATPTTVNLAIQWVIQVGNQPTGPFGEPWVGYYYWKSGPVASVPELHSVAVAPSPIVLTAGWNLQFYAALTNWGCTFYHRTITIIPVRIA